MKYKLLSFFLLINVFSLIYAEEYFPPSLPDNIYGNILINENPGEIGSMVVAKINDVIVNTYRTTELGKYGSQEINNRFLIFDNLINVDKKVTFFLLIDDIEIIGNTIPEEIYYLGGNTQNIDLNFTVLFDNNNQAENINEEGNENENNTEETNKNNSNTYNNNPINSYETTDNQATIENKIPEETTTENNDQTKEEILTDIENQVIEEIIENENQETTIKDEKIFNDENINLEKNKKTKILISVITIVILTTITIIIYLKYIKINKEKYVRK